MSMLLTPVFGDIWPPYLGHPDQYGTGGRGFSNFIASMISLIIIVSGIAFFIYLAIGGLRYITAGGDAKQTQEASKQITNAIIGLAIVVGAYSITRIVGGIFGIDIFHPVFVGP